MNHSLPSGSGVIDAVHPVPGNTVCADRLKTFARKAPVRFDTKEIADCSAAFARNVNVYCVVATDIACEQVAPAAPALGMNLSAVVVPSGATTALAVTVALILAQAALSNCSVYVSRFLRQVRLMSLGSYHAPLTPDVNRDCGVNVPSSFCIADAMAVNFVARIFILTSAQRHTEYRRLLPTRRG